MRVLLTTEARFERTPDGVIWGPAAYGAALWQRYLDVFSNVMVAARVGDVHRPSAGSVRASGPQVEFCPLASYAGLVGFLRHARRIRVALADAVRSNEAVIVRSPSPIGQIVAMSAVAQHKSYGVEIVGDPDQVFAAGAFHHPLRGALRGIATVAQAHLARHAIAAKFVTRHVLQRKYPTEGRIFSASDALLDDAAFEVTEQQQSDRRTDGVFRMITVSALDQPYKGIAVLLEALGRLRGGGASVNLTVVGGGRLLAELQARTRKQGIESHVTFAGQLDRDGVRRSLDAADLFVLPSLTEGLPRALLEAMARGLPAIASHVGGVPELLGSECLVPPGDADALGRRIRAAMHDDVALTMWGRRNREVALGYHERLQIPVRHAFLSAVKEASTAPREYARA
jgi:glycosyltransferase involved in cell wall biosynthesis